MTKPVVPSTVAYRHMLNWQRFGVKLSGQCKPAIRRPLNREERRLSASIMRTVARLDGKANICELLKNVVT